MPRSHRPAPAPLPTIGTLLGAGLLALAVPAHADEGGSSLYLLGSGGPGTAIMAPVRGVFFSNTAYIYSGEADAGRQFPIGGSVVLDLKATVVADFATVLWVPSTDFLGGTLGLGATLPVGHPDIEASGLITGPGGGATGARRSDSAFVVGDPVLSGMLGWSQGNTHLQLSTMVNVPVGDYREDQLANLAFHRWAVDASAALTWHDAKSGWDVSGKAGLTFNGENDYTDYDSGNDFHAELSVEKTFSKAFSAGVQLYHLRQVSDDTGAGATLGPFRGEVTGAGATAAWNMMIGARPATLRLHAFTEFDVSNRLKGDAVMVDFSIPLVMRAP
jgi:hypothetical protein